MRVELPGSVQPELPDGTAGAYLQSLKHGKNSPKKRNNQRYQAIDSCVSNARIPNTTYSITELRDAKKVLEKAGGQPVAILNRDQLIGYFVPAAAVEKISFSPAEKGAVSKLLRKRRSKLKPTLDYLKDK